MATAAQEEFNGLVAKNNAAANFDKRHPEDRSSSNQDLDLTEEDHYRNAQISDAMRASANNDHQALKLPPANFDNGHSTGVKGVIADARSYETARKSSKWRTRVQAARRSIFGVEGLSSQQQLVDERSESEESTGDEDDSSFLAQWRESRRRELESEETSKEVRTRRTSPSVRVYGRMDEVDALGYLDAIEKVSRETIVVVFVYDNECEVSAAVESAMRPLVKANSTVRFVKIHYDEIEFDAAAVPSILAYRNQGDLAANLTGIIEMMPEDDDFGSEALKQILQRHRVL